MGGAVVVLFIAILLILILVLGLIADEFFKIAKMKGHNNRKYFWISFLCGIVGYMLVIALPDNRRHIGGHVPQDDDELPEL